jgi:hypothetical protein
MFQTMKAVVSKARETASLFPVNVFGLENAKDSSRGKDKKCSKQLP